MIEPKWATRLRAYRAENNAQFGGGPTPEEVLAGSNYSGASERRHIQGVGANQMYASRRAAAGGDPAALQRSIAGRQQAHEIAWVQKLQDKANEVERQRRAEDRRVAPQNNFIGST